MLYILYAFLVTGCVLAFIGLLPKPAETISVFGEKVKEKRGSPFAAFLKPFSPFPDRVTSSVPSRG